ncbi:hypothetical protein KP509_11G085500 [Ceratopteris richardii]|uniref:C3H1-type domain-containing protein n=1 Tax=Ceratopteris richardii TaxID=49495 RepID=A0A8T2TUM6_CERRI|nr:hypothetical protein KP509_11G085500 [Ceratopteris richardii]KAH7426118.1 hypothetical protein KP509_11G085500 [Ceratopteris richardii]KAH7426119.1 hypothetical protein KP509_11G085500 [Ceratopteris richardii]KAH7426120.1 hypothetical protein KP509_11G085500 [Ceratopteris richardii]KAH7426121.1 hypothetical protein KP509_11G085500 [Ceratopteris richardii]
MLQESPELAVASSSRNSEDVEAMSNAEAGALGIVPTLLELASSNDVEGFQKAVEHHKVKLNIPCGWYCRQHGTGRMVMEQRTPLMVAALYGSVDVVDYILKSGPGVCGDVNQKCGRDGSSALHCAAAGGSELALEVVKLLLDNGADLNTFDAQGRRPADVIANFPGHSHLKADLERILKLVKPDLSLDLPDGLDCEVFSEDGVYNAEVSDRIVSPASFPVAALKLLSLESPLVSPSSSLSTSSSEAAASKLSGEVHEKVKEYPMDPSVPDIKNSMYTSDEFRMYSFKVRPCSRAYSHDWTECPFVHPGENARRRDPRRFHYSCVPCPDFRKGVCRRGDACEYAHGVFECWLHPAQYRTRLCKDGTKCPRRVCFFAHTNEELRPLYVSTGSAIPSQRSTGTLDIASMSPPLAPGSPSSVLMMSPFSASNAVHQQGNLATPPMSPSSPSGSLSSSWSQSNMPALHLPGVGLHASRLRAALSARDISVEPDLGRASGFEGHPMTELQSLANQVLNAQARFNAVVAASSTGNASSRANKYRSLGLTVAPTNLEDLFASEVASSPRSIVSESAQLSPIDSPMYPFKQSCLPSQWSNEMQSEIQLQAQQMALDAQLTGPSYLGSPAQKSSFGLGPLSTYGLDVDKHDCAASSTLSSRSGAFSQRESRSQSSRNLNVCMPLSDWGSPTGKPEWGVHGDDLSKLRKSSSLRCRKNESDLLWQQNSTRERSSVSEVTSASHYVDEHGSSQRESGEHQIMPGSWVDNVHMDHIIA